MFLIKNKTCQISVVLFFFFFGISINNYSYASSTDFSKSTVSLQAKEVTFNQLIKKIEDLTDIKITIKGVEPTGRRDVSINSKPIEKAIPQILRIFSIKNHSATYFSLPKPHIEILLVNTGHIQPKASNRSDSKSLTESELSVLNSTTADEFNTLRKERFLLLPSDPPDGSKELSDEEFSLISSGPPEPFKTLSTEEFSQLPKGQQ